MKSARTVMRGSSPGSVQRRLFNPRLTMQRIREVVFSLDVQHGSNMTDSGAKHVHM